MRPEVADWLNRFRARVAAARPASTIPGASKSQATYALAYALAATEDRTQPVLHIFKTRLAVDGTIRDVERWNASNTAFANPAKFVSDDDLTILRALTPGRIPNDTLGSFVLSGPNGAAIVPKLLATGRFFSGLSLGKHAGHPEIGAALREGPPREGRIDWSPETRDRLRPVLRASPNASAVLATEPRWYIDAETNEAGLIESPIPARQLADYLSMPSISLAEAPLVAAALREFAPESAAASFARYRRDPRDRHRAGARADARHAAGACRAVRQIRPSRDIARFRDGELRIRRTERRCRRLRHAVSSSWR